jgi:RimJ/RimL family protein N-acetyltransferase
MIDGNNIYLTKINKNDMEYIYNWFSDVEFLKYYDYIPPIPLSKEEVDKIFNEYESKEESIVFAVKLKKNNNIIGIAGFDDIIKSNETATFFIGIGDRNMRKNGYGKETLNLLLEYGYETLNLHRIQLNVLEFNTSAIILYEKAGFKKEGIFREFVLRNNKRYNLLLYGLLKHEWKEYTEFKK